jgi:uncharacterized protein (DUF433 family)
MTDSIITKDPNVVSGATVFAGTRVPIDALFDYLEAGDSLDEFLNDFPSVKREQAIGLLEMAKLNLNGKNEAAA